MELYHFNIFFILINMVRLNPYEYQNFMNVNFICNYIETNPIMLDFDLQKQADDRIPQLNDEDCKETDLHKYHDTCSKYCYLYNSCSYIDRVLYYCNDCINISENLIAYVKSPIKAFHLFLETSNGHCLNILDTKINSIGFSGIGKPWYVQTFAFREKNLPSINNKCSYLWKNDYEITIFCLGLTDFNITILNNNTDYNINLLPLFKYYSYYTDFKFNELNPNFILICNDEKINSIEEKFYYK